MTESFLFSSAVFFLKEIFIMKGKTDTENTGDIQQVTELCPTSL